MKNNKLSRILYVNGCSWTYGEDLKNPPQEVFSTNLKNIFPFEECINDSQCGGSNHRIVRRTINFLLENKEYWDDLFILIGWTCMHRTEFWSDFNKEWLWVNQYRQSENSEKGHKARVFYQNLWNETEAFTDYFLSVLELQSFLKLNNIKYYMFRSFAFQNPQTNEFFGGDQDLELYKKLVRENLIPKTYLDAIDSKYFPSFVNFEKSWHWVINNHIREDGRTFKEHYPAHPNKKEHHIFSEWVEKEIKEIW